MLTIFCVVFVFGFIQVGLMFGFFMHRVVDCISLSLSFCPSHWIFYSFLTSDRMFFTSPMYTVQCWLPLVHFFNFACSLFSLSGVIGIQRSRFYRRLPSLCHIVYVLRLIVLVYKTMVTFRRRFDREKREREREWTERRETREKRLKEETKTTTECLPASRFLRVGPVTLDVYYFSSVFC